MAERLGEYPMDSLDGLVDPEIAGKLSDCGIAVLDSPIEAQPTSSRQAKPAMKSGL